jgi:hypothetical protein
MTAAETKLPKIRAMEMRTVQRTFRLAALMTPEKARLASCARGRAIEAIKGTPPDSFRYQ